MRRTALVAAVVAVTGLAGVSLAELLGVVPGFPSLGFNNGGTTTFVAGTKVFTVESCPIAIQFAPGQVPNLVTGDDILRITAFVNPDGTLDGSPPGDDLFLTGTVTTPNGTLSGLLLRGEICEFGFQDLDNEPVPTTTDFFDFRFTVTGGLLASPWFDGKDVGVVVTSNDSTFHGDFAANFGGSAIGGLGPIDPKGDCDSAVALDLPALVSGSTQCATFDALPACGTPITAPGTWYTVMGTGTTITASLCTGNTNYDSKLSVFCGDCPAGDMSDCCVDNGTPGCSNAECQDTVCALDSFCCAVSWDGICADAASDLCGVCQDIGLLCVGGNDDFCGLQSQVTWCSQAGVQYLILVHGFGNATGSFELEVIDDGVECTPEVLCIPLPALGACCIPGDICAILSEVDCGGAGGEYQGDGTECFTASGSPTVYAATPAAAIPDNNPAGLSSTISVPDSFVVADLNVTLDITHTWVGDLVVTLTHGSKAVMLVNRPGAPALGAFGCDQDNYVGVVLDDEGAGGPIEDQCVANLTSPPSYNPDAALRAFDGLDASGDWTLTVSDNAGQDIGTLNSWSISIDGGTSICGFVEPVLGLLRFTDGTCNVLTEAACGTAGGAFQGDETSCTPNPCPQPGLTATLIIKQGACPAPVNPNSNGVVPIALVGDVGFDVTQVDWNTLLLRRCDGLGGAVAPLMGPPGPGIKFKDLNHPNTDDVGCAPGNDPCACNPDQHSDGIMDLSLKFRTSDMTAALLTAGSQNTVITLVLEGQFYDGTSFTAADCIQLTQPGPDLLQLLVTSQFDVLVHVTPIDLTWETDGFADFTRFYHLGQTITLGAPATHGNASFIGWKVDGSTRLQPGREIQLTITQPNHTVEAVYSVPNGDPADITPNDQGSNRSARDLSAP